MNYLIHILCTSYVGQVRASVQASDIINFGEGVRYPGSVLEKKLTGGLGLLFWV